MGMETRTRPAFDRMLTKRTTSGREGAVPNGFSVSRRIRSRPSHSTTSASKGSFRSNAARNFARDPGFRDRKSTRLNSSHGYISYAVFCLKKKKTYTERLIFSTAQHLNI